MEWVRDFYRLQGAWTGVYSGPVEAHHREKASQVCLEGRADPLRVLELGAGGGQVAAAVAALGHDIVAVDLNPAAIQNARELAVAQSGRMRVVEGDFFEVEVGGPFDVVCYWDGFGIGDDSAQRRLLRRIEGWLAPGGAVFLEIYTPWYWAMVAGRRFSYEGAERRYGFDALGCRMLDTWWPSGDEAQAVTQSLRCYSPSDLELLLDGSALKLADVSPGGAVNYEEKRYEPRVELGRAMQYVARLVRGGEEAA